MNEYSTFNPRFIDDTLLVMMKAIPDGITARLSVITDKAATTKEKKVAREIILHYIGNMVVLAFAGLDHAIQQDRLEDYRRLMLAFLRCRPALLRNDFDILPQIDQAIALVQNPKMDK